MQKHDMGSPYPYPHGTETRERDSMILYFTATGNSKRAAERIAEVCDDEAVSMVTCKEQGTRSFDVKGGIFGIVCPVYFSGLPDYVERYLGQIVVRNSSYTFFVGTYGSASGQAALYAKHILARNGTELDARFTVKMPENCTLICDVTDKGKVARIDEAAETELTMVAEAIKEKTRGNLVCDETPLLVSELMHAAYALARTTRHFAVNDTCVGCGKCARNCPDHAIVMEGGNPVWVKDTCDLCLGCLHRCPVAAISFTRLTAGRGQYLNAHTTL
jgi:ferredoxin